MPLFKYSTFLHKYIPALAEKKVLMYSQTHLFNIFLEYLPFGTNIDLCLRVTHGLMLETNIKNVVSV